VQTRKQKWARQYTPGNPFQRGQQEDQRHVGRMMLKKRYTEVKSAQLEDPCPGQMKMEGSVEKAKTLH
jgi:hypothetical protein